MSARINVIYAGRRVHDPIFPVSSSRQSDLQFHLSEDRLPARLRFAKLSIPFAPVAASNIKAVDAGAPPADTATEPSDATPLSKPSKPKSGRPKYRWPELMRRSFGIDVLQCKHCGGVLKLVDIITHPRAIRGILQSLGLPTEPPLVHASRAPPDDYFDSA